MESLKNLFKNQYNKAHPFFAIRRFIFWKIIRLLRLNDIQYSIWGDRKINLNSNSFHSMWLMYNYIVDWEEFNLIQDFIKNDDQVFDIGTNIGYYTIWISKFITSGKIHCFEPDKANFQKLKKNVELNQLQHITKLNNIAVNDVNGTLSFTSGLDGQNHINLKKSNNNINVVAMRLDSYVKENDLAKISYLKIDVEGFEFNVLKGAENLLKEKKIEIIQLEINNTLQNSNHNVHDILKLLTDHDYMLCGYQVEEKKLCSISYSASRENYFAVYNLNKVNLQLNPIS
jgi:FkbM family methyltransferase